MNRSRMRHASSPTLAPVLPALVLVLAGGCAAPGGDQALRGEAYRDSLAGSWDAYRFADIVEQERDYSCGSTALLTLLRQRFDARDLPDRDALIDPMFEHMGGDRKKRGQGRGFLLPRPEAAARAARLRGSQGPTAPAS